MLAKVLGVRGRQESALMMVKPPGDFWRIRILKIHDHVFVAVKQPIGPGLRRAMGHAGQRKLRLGIESFAVEPIEKRRGSGAVKAAIVKT
jgi:hypothetical protein